MFILCFKYDVNVDNIYNIEEIIGVGIEIIPYVKYKVAFNIKIDKNDGHTKR